jgi:hypothetical protein
MAYSDVKGICNLCLSEQQLQKSHYLPRALYRLCRQNSRNPIVATPTVVEFSQKQMWKPLLCKECENLLSKCGEKYTLDLVHRGDRFSLLERLKLAIPIGESGNTPTYSGLQLGIKTDKLGYFALSLLWRGAQGPWRTIEGHTTEVSLGQYEEPIRQYLHGDSAWPANIAIVTTVCTDRGSQEWILPPWQNSSGFSAEKFMGIDQCIQLLVRGIWFHVLLGKIPEQITDWCCVKSPQKTLFKQDCTELLLMECRHFLESAEDRTNASHLH